MKYSDTVVNGVRVLVAQDHVDCEHLLGQFLDHSHYDILVDEDCDFYAPPTGLAKEVGEHNIIFKLRKNVFTEQEQRGVYEGLIDAAGESQNRGLAAGPKGEKLGQRDWVTDFQADVLEALMNPCARLDGDREVDVVIASYRNKPAAGTTRGMVWLRNKLAKLDATYEGFFDRWLERVLQLDPEAAAKEATELSKTCISQTTYANPVNSGIAGFFDRYPRIPYGRACAYNEKHPEKFELAFPYLRKLSAKFQELLPGRHAAQKAAADTLDPRFRVAGEDTVFTTLTVNKTFRTAAHRDAGDLSTGFSNLGVINAGKNFKGGYLVLPEFRVAVNIRPGDLLLINNHEGIHGNTPIEPAEEGCCPDCLVRMSLVCYFREKMTELGSWEYEQTRRKFVDDRRKDPNHPDQRPLWNGVSVAMWTSAEWYDYLKRQPDGEAMLSKYHPEASASSATLEDFF